jgi:hypothetical protein
MQIGFITASHDEEDDTHSTGRGNLEPQYHGSQLPGVDHVDVFPIPALSGHGHAAPVEPEFGSGSSQVHPYPSLIEASSRIKQASLYLLADTFPSSRNLPREQPYMYPPECTLPNRSMLPTSCPSGQGAVVNGMGLDTGPQEAPSEINACASQRL